MENEYLSLRGLETSCKTNIRYMWLLEDMKALIFATIENFIRDDLTETIDKIIFEKDNVDLTHTYIDRTKIETNANIYICVWKRKNNISKKI